MSDDADEPSIPTVDLGALAHHERAVRDGVAASIREGFSAYGLIYLQNHGVDFGLRDRLHARFLELSGRASEEKTQLADIWFQRGWTLPSADDDGPGSFEQSFVASPRRIEPALKIQYPQICADNVWPEGAEGFEQDTVSLGQQLHEAGLSLLEGVALSLRLLQRTFDRSLEGAPHVLRLCRHLPMSAAQVEDDVPWSEKRTDTNLLTLLPGGSLFDAGGELTEGERAGLYVRTRSGETHPVDAPEGCIIARVGQPLEILTGGAVLATQHGIMPPKTPGHSFVSCAHRLNLHSHQTVFPFERFRTEQTIEAYAPPVLAGTYATKTLVDMGLAPASAIDELGYRHYEGQAR